MTTTQNTVEVTARWESHHTFEFETDEKAEAFREAVDSGGETGLNAIVEAGDVDSSIAELVDWSAS